MGVYTGGEACTHLFYLVRFAVPAAPALALALAVVAIIVVGVFAFE